MALRECKRYLDAVNLTRIAIPAMCKAEISRMRGKVGVNWEPTDNRSSGGFEASPFRVLLANQRLMSQTSKGTIRLIKT